MHPASRTYQVRELFERYYITLVEFVNRIIKCEETARDLAQDIFVKLLENDPKLPEAEFKIKSYLYSMAKNSALNYLRHRKVVQKFEKNHDPSAYISESNLLDALIYAESVYQLHKAIQALPEACQSVCKSTFLEEMTYKETAAVSRTSVNTVKTHRRRAIELLRKQLQPPLRIVKSIFFLISFTHSVL